MAQIDCVCGATIVDTTEPMPDSGFIIRGPEWDSFLDCETKAILSLIAAIVGGRRGEWIKERFGPHYPDDITDEKVIRDLLVICHFDYRFGIYQCENCGRVFIERTGEFTRFHSFAPDSTRDTVYGFLHRQ